MNNRLPIWIIGILVTIIISIIGYNYTQQDKKIDLKADKYTIEKLINNQNTIIENQSIKIERMNEMIIILNRRLTIIEHTHLLNKIED